MRKVVMSRQTCSCVVRYLLSEIISISIAEHVLLALILGVFLHLYNRAADLKLISFVF